MASPRGMLFGVVSPGSLVLVTLVTVAVFVSWWVFVATNVNQAYLVRRAESASAAGEPLKAGDLLRTAVDRSPSSAVPRLVLGRAMLEGSRAEADPARRVALLEAASGVVIGALERNPLEFRAFILNGKILQEAAAFDEAIGVGALAASERAAALLPGLREPWEQLALTLLVIGEYQRAYEASRAALGLLSADDREGAYMHYVQAKAYQGLGQTDEAESIISKMEGFVHRDAPLLIEDLRR